MNENFIECPVCGRCFPAEYEANGTWFSREAKDFCRRRCRTDGNSPLVASGVDPVAIWQGLLAENR